MRELSVCGALQGSELDRLNAIVTHTTVGTGQVVFYESDPAAHLFVIVEGCVRLYKLLADGRRQITGFLFPSDFLGLAHQDLYAYTAETVSPSRLCRFDRGRLEALLQELPHLEKRLLGIASNELASAQDQMLLLGRKSAEEKILTFLYLLSRRAYLKSQSPNTVELPMSRSDIADHLGLTTETVSRCITRLRGNGIIKFDDPHQIAIADWPRCMELAGVEDGLEPNTAA
ncbi:MAG: cyclic nucleotide-binding domain-containing protein [Alphaproteobacteria bacterium]|nr:cyclic nucleotide-binding domain-containing protein [Alphaproteobacteria bacterium]